MRKVLLVAWREIWHYLRSRGYILATIGTPVMLIGVWAISGAFGGGMQRDSLTAQLGKVERPDLPIGYVDTAGFVQDMPAEIPAGLFIPFPDETAAKEALQEKQISAYYVLAPGYPADSQVRRISPQLPLIASADGRLFSWVLAWNLAPGHSAKEIARLRAPFDPHGLQFVPIGAQNLPQDTPKGSGFVPIMAAIIVMMPLFVSGGYLLQGLAQEKENRVFEILLVSLRPSQLLAGKLLGLGILTLVQFASWLILGGLTMKLAGQSPLSFLQAIDLSGSEPILVAAFAAGGFLLYATLMAGLGAIAPNVEATRMWSFVVSAPMLVPVFLSTPINTSPNGALAVVLSILPFSSPVGMLIRLMATTVAPWEVALSLVLLVITAVAMVLAMSRMFRARTLLSGQPLSLHRFWEALRVA